MTELLSRFNPGELIAIVAILGGLITGPVIVAVVYWHDLRKAEFLAGLKQDMLDRGMSAEEIKTVLEAGSKTSPQ